jgi:hypothetical protein
MTAEARAQVARALGAGGPAAPELVLVTAERLGAGTLRVTLGRAHHHHEYAAIIRRLLDAEQQLTALRGVLAQSIAVADECGDVTAGDIRCLLAAVEVNLDTEAAAALDLRMADATGGAW